MSAAWFESRGGMTMSDNAGSTLGGAPDKAALRRKYLQERAKRLRADGNEQYLQLKGRLAHYLEDPYTPRAPRAPRTDHVTFAFIGGGFAGLVTAARLVEAGIRDVRIVEKGGDFGGTWYWNRYPGAQCDTASMVYMPLLEETGHMPSEKYARGPEILAHCQRIGRQYGLYDQALFHTEVQDLAWDAERALWLVRSDRGDAFTAQFIGLGTGPLHVPKLPGIPGIESFKGHSFHTSRWDYGYTGGDPIRRADAQAGRPARGPHRHRGHCGAVRAAPRPRLWRALGVPAHAIVGGRARQRTDRSRAGLRASRPRGGSSAGSRTSPPTRRAARQKRIWCKTAGPTCRAAFARGSCNCRASR